MRDKQVRLGWKNGECRIEGSKRRIANIERNVIRTEINLTLVKLRTMSHRNSGAAGSSDTSRS